MSVSIRSTCSYSEMDEAFVVRSFMDQDNTVQELVPLTSNLLTGLFSVEERIKAATERTRAAVQEQYSKQLHIKQVLERVGCFVEVAA